MTKKLVRHGNSWGVILDKTMLDLIGLVAGKEVEITTDGRSILLTPLDPVKPSADKFIENTAAAPGLVDKRKPRKRAAGEAV